MLIQRTHFEQVSLENLKKILAEKIISSQEIGEQTRDNQGRNQEGDHSGPRRAGGGN